MYPDISPSPDITVLTIQEVAEWLHVRPSTVRGWAASGRLPAFKLGKDWRFFRQDVIDRTRSLLTRNPFPPRAQHMPEDRSREERLAALTEHLRKRMAGRKKRNPQG